MGPAGVSIAAGVGNRRGELIEGYPTPRCVSIVRSQGGANAQSIHKKEEAPLRSLRFSRDIISTIAEVTFFGRDQAGNEISATSFMKREKPSAM